MNTSDFRQKILDTLEKNRLVRPNKVFIYNEETKVTYAEFYSAVSVLKVKFERLKSKKSRMGIYLNNSIEAYVAIYATILAGFAYVPISPDEPSVRARSMIFQAEVENVIAAVGTDLRDLQSLGVNIIEYEYHQMGEAPIAVPRAYSHDEIYIIHTSGTTGAPKGVIIDSINLQYLFKTSLERFGLVEEDIFLALSRISFDMSVLNLFLPFFLGATVYIPRVKSNIVFPGKILQDEKITAVFIVPSITQFIQKAGQFTKNTFPFLRRVMFGGEGLGVHHIEPWILSAPNVEIHNIYAPTEATVICVTHRLDFSTDLDGGPIPIGVPFDGAHLSILDDNGKEVEGGEFGEIVISGGQVSNYPYIGSVASNDPFHYRDGIRSYRTGDIGYRDARGLYFCLGRKDDQCKIRGFRVELGEVDSISNQVLGVLEGACVYRKNLDELVLFFSLKAGFQEEKVRESLAKVFVQKLPPYMRPSKLICLDVLPKNQNNKIDKKKLIS